MRSLNIRSTGEFNSSFKTCLTFASVVSHVSLSSSGIPSCFSFFQMLDGFSKVFQLRIFVLKISFQFVDDSTFSFTALTTFSATFLTWLYLQISPMRLPVCFLRGCISKFPPCVCLCLLKYSEIAFWQPTETLTEQHLFSRQGFFLSHLGLWCNPPRVNASSRPVYSR